MELRAEGKAEGKTDTKSRLSLACVDPGRAGLGPVRLLKIPRGCGRSSVGTERGGFEPPMDGKPIPVFETGAFNRSATSPGVSL
jgi:hypothetical protein